MRATTNRQPKRSNHVPIKTIDIFQQLKPAAYVDLGYVMSVPAPLQDPCAYGASFSGPHQPIRFANRISKSLAPTFEETEGQTSPKRSTEGDPTFRLAQLHDLESYKESITLAGIPISQYRARQHSRPAVNSATHDSTADSTMVGDITSTNAPPNPSAMVTPMRRTYDGPQGSTTKRQRTSRSAEGDVSMDTVRSVLKMIDNSLIETPERTTAVTPKVSRAAPGPSPREQGPTYAYSAESSYANCGGLVPRTRSTLTPFSLKRI